VEGTVAEYEKYELSLLLFLECRIVDHSGRVNAIHMNNDDFAIAERWNEEGLIGFGRIASEDINDTGAHWVTFSEDAWDAAHAERRARGARNLERRTYRTTQEKRETSSATHVSG
jgi:hypothetical protein